jgi:hypothetical protein
MEPAPQLVKALYTTAYLPDSHTPALEKDEVMTLIRRHDNGWLEIQTRSGEIGYISPAWVEPVAPQDSPVVCFVSVHPPPSNVRY